jgi:MFS family permease
VSIPGFLSFGLANLSFYRTGINAITYFMSTLMQRLGFDKYQSNYMSLVGGGSLLIGTIPAVLFMERCGRRFWACSTLPIFFCGLIIAGVSQYCGGQGAQMGTYFPVTESPKRFEVQTDLFGRWLDTG